MNKKEKLLQGLPDNFIKTFKTDSIGLFSITSFKEAQIVSNLIKKYCVLDENHVIIDACACVGGNTISFLINFKNVIAIEKNKIRYKMLVSNTKSLLKNKLYDYENKSLKTINSSCLEFLQKSKNNFDVIFFDPPWGGSEYKNKKSIDLFLDDKNIIDIVLEFKHRTKYICFKLPKNYKMSIITKLIKDKKIKLLFQTNIKHNYSFWIFVLFEVI